MSEKPATYKCGNLLRVPFRIDGILKPDLAKYGNAKPPAAKIVPINRERGVEDTQ